MIDKKVRRLPKKLSSMQKLVLASYPNARCGTADALKHALKPIWNRESSYIGDFGKDSKWVIYTEPENENITLLSNVIGLDGKTQSGAWEDAANVIGKFMIMKLER